MRKGVSKIVRVNKGSPFNSMIYFIGQMCFNQVSNVEKSGIYDLKSEISTQINSIRNSCWQQLVATPFFKGTPVP